VLLSLGFGGIDNGRSGRGSRQILVEMAPAACSGLGVPWPHGRHLRAMDFLETGRPDVDKDEDEVIRHRASWRMQRKSKSDPSRDRCGLSVGAGVAGVQLGWQETHEARSNRNPPGTEVCPHALRFRATGACRLRTGHIALGFALPAEHA
jgi:hypothetical protein